MKLNFTKILFKPLTYTNIPATLIKLFFVVIPAIVTYLYAGMYSWMFITAAVLALIIIIGYFFALFKEEMEIETNELPDKSLVESIFAGVKGIFFTLSYVAAYAAVYYFLYVVSYYLPEASTNASIIAVAVFVFWFFVFYPVALGIFADGFNTRQSMDFSLVVQILGSAWFSYLTAFIYMIVYTLILVISCLSLISLTQGSYEYYILGLFTVYYILVYFILYAKVYKHVRTKFESHI